MAALHGRSCSSTLPTDTMHMHGRTHVHAHTHTLTDTHTPWNTDMHSSSTLCLWQQLEHGIIESGMASSRVAWHHRKWHDIIESGMTS